jgi:glycosyltransferase involved in cell wall biosynthesis
LKVALISRTPPARCGIAEYTSMLGEALSSLGVDVVLVGNVEEKDGLPRTYSEPYSGLASWKCFSVRRFKALDVLKCLEDSGPFDVVHIQHDYSIFTDNNEFLKLLEKLSSRVPAVVTMHTVLHSLRGSDVVSFQSKVAALSAAVVVHSELQEYELYAQGADMVKIYRVPHGTALNPYVGRVEKEQVLSELAGRKVNVGEDTLIAVPGFARWNKGVDVAVEAFKILLDEGVEAKLILGAPQHGVDERLYTLAESKLGKSSRLVLIRRYMDRYEMFKLLAAVDLAIFPYRDPHVISVSGALHMAMGSFVKVACTRHPKLVECELLAPEAVFPALDSRLLAYKIREVIARGSAAASIYRNLWRYAYETEWRRVAKTTLKLYEALLSYKGNSGVGLRKVY